MMERYLLVFGGHWRTILEEDIDVVDEDDGSVFECDLCHSDGEMALLTDRIGNRDSTRKSEFTHFEPYLCDSHARELGLLW